MSTNKRILQVGQLSKDLLDLLSKPTSLKQQIIEELVEEEPIDWAASIADAVSTNTEIVNLVQSKAGPTNTPVDTSKKIPAAIRYYLIHPSIMNSDETLDQPFFGPVVGSDYYEKEEDQGFVYPDKNKIFLQNNERDLYKINLPGYPLHPEIAATADKIYNVDNIRGLNNEPGGTYESPLFVFQTFGPKENLTPFSNTTDVTWTNKASCFTIDETHDYHFAFNLKLKVIDGVSFKDKIEKGSSSYPSLAGAPVYPTGSVADHSLNEVSIYVRLHNGEDDDQENLSKLSPSFPTFFKLSQRVLPRSNLSHQNNVFLEGGFRLRGLIDDYISETLVMSDTPVNQRARFKHVDILLGFHLSTRFDGGPCYFILDRNFEGATTRDLSNYIDVVDLGKVL